MGYTPPNQKKLAAEMFPEITPEKWKHEKTNPCIKLYGLGPVGAKCKTCCYLEKRSYNKSIYKCGLRKMTRSEATDHRVNWPACAAYIEKTKE